MKKQFTDPLQRSHTNVHELKLVLIFMLSVFVTDLFAQTSKELWPNVSTSDYTENVYARLTYVPVKHAKPISAKSNSPLK